MTNRTRNARISFLVTPEEEEIIKQKVQMSGMHFESFARRMLIHGEVLNLEVYDDVKSLSGQLGKIGGNVRQIARVAKESEIPQCKIEELMSTWQQTVKQLEGILKRVIKYLK